MIDAVVAAVLAVSTIFGYLRGFVRQLVSVVGWFAAYFVAYIFSGDVAPLLQTWFPVTYSRELSGYGEVVEGLDLDRYIYRVVAFALLFFGTKLILSVAGYLMHGVASLPGIRFFNRWAGALLAVCEAAIVIVIAVLVMDVLPSEQIRLLLENSLSVRWLNTYTPELMERLKGLWGNT